MTSVESAYNHRAALALNNMAVYLMKRRQYLAANETFLDSILVLQQCFHETSPKLSGSNIRSKLKQAEQRVSHVASLINMHCSHGIFIIPQSDVDTLSLRSHMFQYGFNTPYLFPILLEPLGVIEEKIHARELDMDAIVLLYNYGTLHMCHNFPSGQGYSILSKQRALCLFEHAHSILVTQIHGAMSDLCSNDRRIVAYFLLTRSLHQVYMDLQCHSHAIQARRTLFQAWELMDQQFTDLELLGVCIEPIGASAA
jgi:hypothetical protein